MQVVGAVIVSKKLRTTGNMFIVNLAIADLIVILIVEPFNYVGKLSFVLSTLTQRNVWSYLLSQHLHTQVIPLKSRDSASFRHPDRGTIYIRQSNIMFIVNLLCYSIFSFLCNVLQIIVCPSVLFLLAIVLYVLLRYTDSGYPFGIFKIVFKLQ